MKKRLIYLGYAVLFNALGTAMMAESNLGMSAWGTAAINLSKFLGVSLGVAFNIVAVVFYIFALLIMRRFSVKEALLSFGFSFSFGLFSDIFMYMIPDIPESLVALRIIINIIGLFVLLFGIAIHLRINLAVHPMDVYLGAVQKAMKSVAKGAYLAYSSAFFVSILFGWLSGGIIGIGLGTLNTLVFGGLILDFYDKKLRI